MKAKKKNESIFSLSQVDVDAISLNSNDVFVLKLPTKSGYTWIGKGASKEEEKGAKYVAGILKCQTLRIEEGHEPRECANNNNNKNLSMTWQSER